jgi:hypothetical protein
MDPSLHVFYEEIAKAAAAMPVLRRAARLFTNDPIHGALAGAGVGIGSGLVAPAQGESRVQSALRRGVVGAGIGGGASAVGRTYRDARLLDPTLSASAAVGATAKRIGQGAKRFAKRQIHGFTGAYADEAGEIGLRGTAEAKRKLHLHAVRNADKVRHGEMTGTRAVKDFTAKKKELADWGRAGDEALAAGITSLPGTVKGLATAPVKTLKAVGRDVASGGRLGTVMAGAPVVVALPELARGDESATGGRSMRQKLVGVGSGIVGGALTQGVPILPQQIAGAAMDAGARRLARPRRPVAVPVPAQEAVT